MDLKIKICGLRYPENIIQVAELEPDMMGFIFCRTSPRYAADTAEPGIIRDLPSSILRTGVFVNETEDAIKRVAEKYRLDIIQLHGDETPQFCSRIRKHGLKVIKVFRVSREDHLQACSIYSGNTDFFLFDTLTDKYGGSGKKFDWNILKGFISERPFIISGGISSQDTEKIRSVINKSFYGIDLNSRFETDPGVKDIVMLKEFIKSIRKNRNTL